MSSYDTTMPHDGGFTIRIGRGLRAGFRALQYARMIRAMSGLSDEQLEAIGLRRSDIPTRAHRCIYGFGA